MKRIIAVLAVALSSAWAPVVTHADPIHRPGAEQQIFTLTCGGSEVTLIGASPQSASALVVDTNQVSIAFLATVTAEATIVRGRCLPYGDGITFWPVAEVVRSVAALGEETDPAVVTAQDQGDRRVPLLQQGAVTPHP